MVLEANKSIPQMFINKYLLTRLEPRVVFVFCLKEENDIYWHFKILNTQTHIQ